MLHRISDNYSAALQSSTGLLSANSIKLHCMPIFYEALGTSDPDHPINLTGNVVKGQT